MNINVRLITECIYILPCSHAFCNVTSFDYKIFKRKLFPENIRKANIYDKLEMHFLNYKHSYVHFAKKPLPQIIFAQLPTSFVKYLIHLSFGSLAKFCRCRCLLPLNIFLFCLLILNKDMFF